MHCNLFKHAYNRSNATENLRKLVKFSKKSQESEENHA